MNLLQFFSDDHRSCDALWATVEEAADSANLATTKIAWTAFSDAMEHHLGMEEEVLFPAFEEATGMMGGPTAVMRAEHRQMRSLMGQMGVLLQHEQLEELIDQGDTLLMLIQQHNAKEEGMLYPMAQRVLGPQWAQLQEQFSKR